MSMTDPIAAYLTILRNAMLAKKSQTQAPASKLKSAISKVLKAEGFIHDWREKQNGTRQYIEVDLKYNKGKSVVREIKRVSKPGCRVYTSADEIPVFKNGVGVLILSTPKGLLTDRQARAEKVGGEILCSIW